MLIHMVCFKYKPGVDAAARAEHWNRLRGLRDIDGIVDLKVGGDVVQSARSYDAGLLIIFRDRAAHDAYQKNPRHVPVAQFGAANAESIVAADFES
jgi:hypothetical protein